MSDENLSDSNTSKQFTMIQIHPDEYVETLRHQGSNLPYIVIHRRGFNGGIEFKMEGNAYLLEGNKTIACYAYTSH